MSCCCYEAINCLALLYSHGNYCIFTSPEVEERSKKIAQASPSGVIRGDDHESNVRFSCYAKVRSVTVDAVTMETVTDFALTSAIWVIWDADPEFDTSFRITLE